MLALYHGHDVDLPGLRRRFPVSLKGTGLSRLMSIAESLGFHTRPLRLEPEQLAELRAPCIVHWDLNHFVVLRRVRGKRIELHDPARGAVTWTRTDFGVDAQGQLHFFEVNQAGQFLFAEEMLPSLPLLGALCAMLAQARPDYAFDPAAPGPRYANYSQSDEYQAWWAEVSPGIRGSDGAIPGVSQE